MFFDARPLRDLENCEDSLSVGGVIYHLDGKGNNLSLLDAAVWSGNTEIVKLLLDRGADVNATRP